MKIRSMQSAKIPRDGGWKETLLICPREEKKGWKAEWILCE
jgi:hypothetical protein